MAINNEVTKNTLYGSDGDSGITIINPSEDFGDTSSDVKIGIINNQVSENVNNVPCYKPNYDNAQFLSDNSIDIPRNDYCTEDQTYIQDGNGVAVINHTTAVDSCELHGF